MAHHLETFRANLADDVVFGGLMGPVEGGNACTEAIQHLAETITDIVVTKVFADGPNVLTWHDMQTKQTDPMHAANWFRIELGKIARIRVFFEPRPRRD